MKQERIQKKPSKTRRDLGVEKQDDARIREQVKKNTEEVKESLDDILDEIDSVLEENAELFVRNYIQKGGE